MPLSSQIVLTYHANSASIKYAREISSGENIIYSHFLTTKSYYSIAIKNDVYYY
ncbi:hypothetical protein SEHO0A_04327 [Salmonella enterica subsp. houtenae str. ATCC BAA-1581]|nr:hypothetical protein SEHO0A_04327 [Salmonella enterica subsp. houtenae str. ATCC BAA-1581]